MRSTSPQLRQHLRRATCAESLSQSNLRRATCTEQLHKALAQSNLHRPTCTDHMRKALARSNWRRAVAQSNLLRALAQSNLHREHACSSVQQLAESNLRAAAWNNAACADHFREKSRGAVREESRMMRWSSHVTIHTEHRRAQRRSPQRCKKVSPRLDERRWKKCLRANRPLVFFKGNPSNSTHRVSFFSKVTSSRASRSTRAERGFWGAAKPRRRSGKRRVRWNRPGETGMVLAGRQPFSFLKLLILEASRCLISGSFHFNPLEV